MPFLLLYMALFTWPGSPGWRKILPDITGSYIWRRMTIFLFVKCSSSLTFCGLPMYRLWSFISFSRTKRIITYYRTCIFLFTGMTIFLIVSTLWPNGQHLRPAVMPRDNIFTRMVAALYRTDTPTNLWPSIHVYNSLGAHFAIIRSKCFEKKKGIRIGSLILAVSIIMATMFIKQHSVFDVLTAFVMAAVMYTLVYRYDLLIAVREFRNKRKAKPQIG